ncbi:hypothetical protein HII17_06690 [Thalassotalea sp. M1531]|uniref:Uncharacterized protein n=1 Tax=Thalassotalea algicola TaxID=2716224 RepID=A0A7Y0LBU1_9GAMM|nr:hypothetical protein [Thalassotalea algicola]NMP31242.1 hypothetical protein [Thalassotalea algicola]
MSKYLLCVLLALSISFNVFAEEEKQPPPLDPAYEGIHGMALMQKGSTVFASHMPMYAKPHNVQLVYKLEVKDVNLLQVVRDNPLVTVKPEKFNLQRLMRGEELAVKADLYIGHFERDGLVVYEGITLQFDKQLFVRELTEPETSGRVQEYTAVSYNRKNDRLYIHHIQQKPSYDHILHIDLDASCPTKIATSSAVPNQDEIHRRFINCGTMKPLYYETQDFEK